MIRHYLQSTPAPRRWSSRFVAEACSGGVLPAGEALAKGQVASPAGRFFGLGLAQ